MFTNDNPTFHVVCHDCPFESLESDSDAAHRLADDHATTTEHSTRYAQIQ